MSALSAVFWGVLVLSVLVVVHEGGHFLVARACGVRVTEFFLGMPCRFNLHWKSERYGTVFGVTPILLGGYNRICGMEGQGSPHMARVLAAVQERGRVSVDGLAAELGIPADVVADDLEVLMGWGSVAEVGVYEGATAPAELVPEGFAGGELVAYETLRRDGEGRCEYDPDHDFSLAGTTAAGVPHPVADADAFLESERRRTFEGKGFLQRLAILIAGPAVNVVLAFVLVVGLLMATPYEIIVDTNVLGGVAEGGLAEQAGIQAGDALVDVAGTPAASWSEIVDALDVALGTGEPFEVTYERDGEARTVEIAIPEGGAEYIGITATTESYHLNLGEAVQATFSYIGFVASTVVRLLQPEHAVEIVSQSSSVVGISVMASEAAASGLPDLLSLVAAISLSLGFMNLLPVPPLDGGKIVIAAVEAVIRRPVPMKVQAAISYVGLGLLLLLFVFALRNDIVNIIGL